MRVVGDVPKRAATACFSPWGQWSVPLGNSSFTLLLAANVGAVTMPWMILYQGARCATGTASSRHPAGTACHRCRCGAHPVRIPSSAPKTRAVLAGLSDAGEARFREDQRRPFDQLSEPSAERPRQWLRSRDHEPPWAGPAAGQRQGVARGHRRPLGRSRSQEHWRARRQETSAGLSSPCLGTARHPREAPRQ